MNRSKQTEQTETVSRAVDQWIVSDDLPQSACLKPKSAFNTVDFQRQHPFNFDRFGYRLKKVYKKVQDLAVMHSVISNEAGRINVQQRYRALVDQSSAGKS